MNRHGQRSNDGIIDVLIGQQIDGIQEQETASPDRVALMATMRQESIQALFRTEALCGFDESAFGFFGDFRFHSSNLR